jgi:aspartyl-tRNA(Asn)/glutamyl-tRNA(Gln) amidotransferase subunit C
MALTQEEVKKIATLARLRLSPEEETRFAGQLAQVVDYIDQLQRFETEPGASLPSLSSPEPAPESEDRTHRCLPRERFLENAPAALDGFLLVPEVKGGAADA